MTTYTPDMPNSGATHEDILIDGYGQRLRIIGETPNGIAWLVISERDIRRVIIKTTRESIAGRIVAVQP